MNYFEADILIIATLFHFKAALLSAYHFNNTKQLIGIAANLILLAIDISYGASAHYLLENINYFIYHKGHAGVIIDARRNTQLHFLPKQALTLWPWRNMSSLTQSTARLSREYNIFMHRVFQPHKFHTFSSDEILAISA